jgi:hypothetical protein
MLASVNWAIVCGLYATRNDLPIMVSQPRAVTDVILKAVAVTSSEPAVV